MLSCHDCMCQVLFMAAIRKALEKAGVEFTNGKRPGVRLGVKIEKRLQKARPEAVSFCKFAS